MLKLDDYFECWPFSPIPDRNDTISWAGRPTQLKELNSLLAGFDYRPQSTLDLVWAAFGAGKTHLLYYLAQESAAKGNVLPWYCVIPPSARSFSEVYRCLMQSIPMELSRMSMLDGTLLRQTDIDVIPVLEALLLGSREQKRIAHDWLSGVKIDMRAAKRLVPVPYRLETADQMQRILIQTLRWISLSGNRVLLLLDEYQRIQAHHGTTKDILNSTMLDAYNAIPKGLSIIYSCSAAQQATAYRLLPPEIQDRMRGRKLITLPELSEVEAADFLAEIIQNHRPANYCKDKWAPFDVDAVSAGIQAIAHQHNGGLLPRHLIQVFDYALSGAIEDGADRVRVEDVMTSLAHKQDEATDQDEQAPR